MQAYLLLLTLITSLSTTTPALPRDWGNLLHFARFGIPG